MVAAAIIPTKNKSIILQGVTLARETALFPSCINAIPITIPKVIKNSNKLNSFTLLFLTFRVRRGTPPIIRPIKNKVVGKGNLSKHKLMTLLINKIDNTAPNPKPIKTLDFSLYL